MQWEDWAVLILIVLDSFAAIRQRRRMRESPPPPVNVPSKPWSAQAGSTRESVHNEPEETPLQDERQLELPGLLSGEGTRHGG